MVFCSKNYSGEGVRLDRKLIYVMHIHVLQIWVLTIIMSHKHTYCFLHVPSSYYWNCLHVATYSKA